MSNKAEIPMTTRADVLPLSPTAVVKLEIRLPARIAMDRVPAVLDSADAPWLGERLPDDDQPARHFACDLELGVGVDRRVAFRKSAIVSLGRPERVGSGWQTPIEWRAATLAPLFPVFVGKLVLEADAIALLGFYAPPFGDVGVALDRFVLGLGARRVARWLLRKVVAACEVPR